MEVDVRRAQLLALVGPALVLIGMVILVGNGQALHDLLGAVPLAARVLAAVVLLALLIGAFDEVTTSLARRVRTTDRPDGTDYRSG